MDALGLDIKILIAQIVNFGILFFVLKKVLYKPIIKILDERKNKIAESLENGNKIREELDKIEKKKAELITASANEAKKDKENIIALAKEEKRKIIDEAKRVSEATAAKSIQKIKAAEEQSYENMRKRFMNDAVSELIKKISSSKIKDEFTKNTLR